MVDTSSLVGFKNNQLIGIIDNTPTQDLGSRKSQLNNMMKYFEGKEIKFKQFTLLSGKNDIESNLSQIQACNGLILTGSFYNLSQIDDPKSDIAKSLIKVNKNLLKFEINLISNYTKPILGICFGHQLLGYAFNNKILRIPVKHSRNIEKTLPSGENKIVTIDVKPGFRLLPSKQLEKYPVNVSHQDEIAAIGIQENYYSDEIMKINDIKDLQINEFQIYGWNPTTKVIQAIQHQNRPIFGVQFHPEYDFKSINSIGKTGLTLFSEFFTLCR